MFTELHLHTDRDFRRLDLAEKMAQRRAQSPAAKRRSPLRATMARVLFAPTATAEKHGAWSVAGEGSGARGRT